MTIELPPLDIRYGPISWHMKNGFLLCDWCNTALTSAGMTGNQIHEYHLPEPELRRVWFPISNTYQWICNRCDDQRFLGQDQETLADKPHLRSWYYEHLLKIGHGYHEPSVVLRHEIGIWCSLGGHGWGRWDAETQALIGKPCDMAHPGTWQASNQIYAWKHRNEWCRCGKQASKQYDGEGIYYGHYCDTCWQLAEFDHVRNYKHDYLDAGEYLDAEDY